MAAENNSVGLGTTVPAKGKTGHWRIYGVSRPGRGEPMDPFCPVAPIGSHGLYCCIGTVVQSFSIPPYMPELEFGDQNP